MLVSRACQWRSLRALQPEVSAAYNNTLRRAAYIPSTSRFQTDSHRFASTNSFGVEVDVGLDYDPDKEQDPNREHLKNSPYKASTHARGIDKRMRNAVKGNGTYLKPWSLTSPTPKTKKPEFSSDRIRELEYLNDPLDLANFVLDRLAKGYKNETVDLVRLASTRGINCVVSWNHIINHSFQKGHLKDAYKFYNEMKKRGQQPDSYTFTVLLRGYADHAHVTNVLGHALSIYHAMSAPNSSVPPSVMHTNAALKVCARAHNADAVWSIASKIPDGGPNTANNVTFTTILNFLHQSALIDGPPGETEHQALLRRERSIVDGRRIWIDVVGKWSSGRLRIDEELVCAMGHLLMIGSRPRDWDDVFSLFAQTMDIPRLVPRLGTTTADSDVTASTTRHAPHLDEEPQAFEVNDGKLGPAAGTEFLPLTQKSVGIGRATPLLYAKPGNNALSLIQQACLKIVNNKESTAYWNLFTDPSTYGIKPDLNNLNMRLRVLRTNRASREAAELLERYMINSDVKPVRGTFRIAITSCLRDQNNPNMLGHAGRIVDAMASTLVDADSRTASIYADLVYQFAPDVEAIKVALIRLEPILSSIKIQLGFGKEAQEGSVATATWELQAEERVDAMETIRLIYRLYERVVARKEVADEELRPFIEGRSRLGSLLNRLDYINKRKIAARRAKLSEEREAKDDDDVPPYARYEREGERRKKVRARHHKDGVEVFEAWEEQTNSRRSRASRRNNKRGAKRLERKPQREEAGQWDRVEQFKGSGARDYRAAGRHFGVQMD